MELELLHEPLISRDTRLRVVVDVEGTGELRVLVLTMVDCSSLSVSVFAASVSLPLSRCEGEEEEQRVEEEMTRGRTLEDCLVITGDRVPELTPDFLTVLSGSDNWRDSFFSRLR